MDAQILLTFRMGEHGEGILTAGILDGRPDTFSGEFCFLHSMDFSRAAELFGGRLSYPADLKENGFQEDQVVGGKAGIWYRVSDGAFGLTVILSKLWKCQYGSTDFSVDNMKGYLEYLGNESKQYRFCMRGELTFGRYSAEASLELGTGGASLPTLLSFKLGSKSEMVLIPQLVDTISGSGSYEALPLPEEYHRPEHAFGLKAGLNLTERTLLLQGRYQLNAKADAEAVLYFSKQKEENAYFLGVQLKNFALADISSALAGADGFLGLNSASAAAILSNMEQDIPDFAEVFLQLPKKVKRGLTLQAELAFSDSFFKDAMDIQGCCLIAGFIPQDKKERLELSGTCNAIVFLGFLSLEEVSVSLTKTGRGLFSFCAEGIVGVAFDKERKKLSFHAGISVKRKETGAREILLSGMLDPIEEPLGIPQTTIEELGFYAFTIETQGGERQADYYFQGKVKFSSLKLAAKILFYQQMPAVVEITLTGREKLSISQLAKKYLGLPWPDILDIELYGGSICYSLITEAVRGISYQQRFYASLHTRIFMLPVLQLSVFIDSGSITASAQFDEAIDLFFIRFYLKEADIVKGPRVSVGVGKASWFTLTSQISFLKVSLGKVKITVEKQAMRGRLTFPEECPISGSVGFSWNENGFSLDECPIQGIPKLNFKMPPLNFPAGGGCSFATKSFLKINTVPDITSKGMEIKGEEFSLSFDLVLSLKSESFLSADSSADGTFLELPFRDLRFGVHKSEFNPPDFKKFMEILGDNAVSLVEQSFHRVVSGEVFEDVLSQKGMERLVKFLTIQGMKWAVEGLMDFLVCKLGKELLAEALVSALTSASETFWKGLGIFLSFAGLLGSLDDDGNYTVDKGAPKENADPAKNPETPEAPALSFKNNKMIISWTACKNASGYRPCVFRDPGEGMELTLSACEETSYEIPGTDGHSLYQVSYGYVYRVRIYAWNDEGSAIGGESVLYILDNPKNVKVHYLCENRDLRVTWDAVERAEEYEVQVEWKEASESRRLVQTCMPDLQEALFQNFEPGKQVNISVRGKAKHVIGPLAEFEPLYLYDLEAPEAVEGYAAEMGIAVFWTKVPCAWYYFISCRDEAGTEVYAADISETQICIQEACLQEGCNYIIQIRACTADITGRMSVTKTVLWYHLPIPKIFELICGEDGLLIFGLSVRGRRYMQMVFRDGKAVNLTDLPLACEWEIKKSARVRLLEENRQGKWSDEILVAPLKTPGGINLTVLENSLLVTWEATGEDVFYRIELRAGDYQLVSELLGSTRWESSLAELPENRRVYVYLFSVDRQDNRRRSNAAQVSFEAR